MKIDVDEEYGFELSEVYELAVKTKEGNTLLIGVRDGTL